MTLWERLRQGWPTTFGIHVFQMLLAGTFAVPLVASVSAPDVLVRAPVAAWIAAMRLGEVLGSDTLRRTILPLAAAGLNYPWLSVAWLRALDQGGPFLPHARYALAYYRSAAGIALATLLALAALAAAAGASAYGIHGAFADSLSDRSFDLAVLASAGPFLLAGLAVVTLQDAAYAAVSRGTTGFLPAVRAGLRATSARLAALRAAFALGQLAWAIASWLAPRALFGTGVLADLGVLFVTQLAAIALTSARAAWLAIVLDRLSRRPGSESRALRAAGSTPPTR